MDKNQHLTIARRPHVWVFALAAAALAACSPSTGATTAQAPTVTPVISTVTQAPVAPSTPPATPVTTVTVTAPPPVTVTVDAPVPATPVAHEVVASGPFQSPSGNIRCNLYIATGGQSTALCAVTNHDWVASQPANCQAAWGDRVDLEEGSAARFGCYGQELPPPTHTLEYGTYQTLGSISCSSETVGIMCIDNNTGHYFSVSRQTVHLG
ncbi:MULTISPECIES: hypothetical protein [unclassified Mycobacterium]|uniref:hypothetical protein n=1 Tax=unclassified Mycobacterium TaxID=2642494 RepID=UPI0029C87166|nr:MULTISPECIES: hypothetical protein [unclassified Mycobacterium]